jgi:DNA-binding transcriptional LysR family regulator
VELRELKSFSVAARLRSISKAAEHLGVGQPTVTKHVKNLEEEFGLVLFERVKRPIQLTLAGSSLAQMVAPLIEAINELVSRAPSVESEGPVRLASTHEIITHTLLQTVKAFRSAYPNTRVQIRSGNRREVLQRVEEGVVDIGIVPGPENSAGFDFQGLFPYERVLLTPSGHPLLQAPVESLEQIAKWPLILMGQHSSTRMLLEGEFRRRGLSFDVVVELDNMDMIKRYVALGLGISVGPSLVIEPQDDKELGIVSLATILPVEQAGIVTLRGKTIPSPTQNFISVMKHVHTSTRFRA